MAIDSYNETQKNQLATRHIFLPDPVNLACEAIIAVVALCLFNLSTLSGEVLVRDTGTTNPLTLLPQLTRNLLSHLDHLVVVQEIILFSVWAVVGVLVYVLIFQSIRLAAGIRQTIKSGAGYVRRDPDHGILLWLASLHDFFVSCLFYLTGAVAVLIGTIICFGIASQELHNSLVSTFPTNAGQAALSIFAAIISVRIIVIGLTLLSGRFRRWYIG